MRLFIRQRFFSWTDSFDITDEEGYAVYSVRADLLALSHVLRVFDDQDQEVGLVREKLFHFLPTFEVELDGDLVAVIRKEFSFLHPRYRIDCEGWSVEGNLFGWDYQIYRDSELCGTISKEIIALTDTYVIDFDDPQDELMVVMLVLAIDAANCSEH